ncbi:MAG: hypothetical protein KH828_12005 [Clostridiales bacterium]|nr:hypothetical protein [Clostridiales bacterium]
MAKLRKMLGKADDPQILEMMGVIETQSKQTLAAWAADYVEKNYLDIYENAYPGDGRFREIISAVKDCINGVIKAKDLKPFLREANGIARQADADPAAQAAARALATACSVVQTPTGALGFAFYGAAASAYQKAGPEESTEVYDALGSAELDRILASLRLAAVSDEPNPVKVKWHC